MAVTKAQKSEILKQLVSQMKDAKSVVFADFQGLSVKELKELRRSLSESGVELKVAKKTLLRLAAKDAGLGEVPEELMVGPVAAAFSMEDETAAAKILFKYGKKHENLKLRSALFEGKILNFEETKVLALIPSKPELISKFIYLIKYPISGFHGVLQNTLAGFVRALNAIAQKQTK